MATWIDGRPLLDKPDPKLVLQAVADHCCHVCGQPLELDDWAVIVVPQALQFGIAEEPPGHFECLQYATAICPYLRRRPANLIVSCQEVEVVVRPSLPIAGSAGTVTILGAVTHLAWVKEGKVIDYAVPEEDENTYEDIASIAENVLESATGIKVKW